MKILIDQLDFIIKYRFKFYLKRIFNKNKITTAKKIKLLFYPQLPHRRTIMYKICQQLGIKILNNSSAKNDGVFIWEDKTFSDVYTIKNPGQININKNCNDISKEKVDRVFEQIFGYSLSVGPTSYNGKCLIKSNENAKHDGRIINCPINEKEPDCVYQIILNNYENENIVKDIRVPIIGDEIPLVYFKFKKAEDRFTNEIDSVEVHDTSTVFSEEETDNIIRFSREMNLDYGELDVLRNLDDSKIYIVDVNKTPWGPPAGISESDSNSVLLKLSNSFYNYIKIRFE